MGGGRRSPFAVHRSPFTVHGSPFAVHRSAFGVRRSAGVAVHSNKLAIQCKGLLQKTQILRTRYFHSPEGRKVAGDVLGIK
jgi:hypothetical protein